LDSLRKRLTTGALWTAVGRILVNLIGLTSTLVLARLLTPADFGLVAIATVVLSIANAFTELSLSAALIQHRDPQREHYDTAWTLNVLRALTIAIALALAAYPVSVAYQDKRLVDIFFVLSAAAMVSGLVNPRLVDFRRQLSFQQEIITDFANKLFGFVVAAGIAYAYRSYWALVIGSFAGQVAGLVMSYVLLPYAPRFSLTNWRPLFSFSGWMALSSGLNAINFRADQLAVGAVLGTEPLGHYTVGDNLAVLPVRESTTPLANVLFPAFSRLQDDTPRLRAAFLRAQSLLAATALPIGVGFALIAAPLFNMLLGPQWTSAALVAQFLSTIYAVQALTTPVMSLAMSLARTRMLFLRSAFLIVVRYPLIFLGLFSGELVGLLVARCVSGLFAVALDITLARRLVGATIVAQIASSWRAFTATSIMAAGVWGVGVAGVEGATIAELALLVMTGAICYVGATVGLWLATGARPGPEREALEMLKFMYGRISGARRPETPLS
jgi:O-antigen/teichoic acid export membrane protein